MHFAREYRVYPDGSHDLLGLFDTFTSAKLPIRTVFWGYAQIGMDPDESGASLPMTMRLTTPNGQSFDWRVMPVVSEPAGHHPPLVWWAHRQEIDLALFGYYTLVIIDTEWGKELGSHRLLVRRGEAPSESGAGQH